MRSCGKRAKMQPSNCINLKLFPSLTQFFFSLLFYLLSEITHLNRMLARCMCTIDDDALSRKLFFNLIAPMQETNELNDIAML
jgi:hypothetical protein